MSGWAPEAWLTLASFVGVGVVSALGLVYRLGKLEAKMNGSIETLQAEARRSAESRASTYKRLDELAAVVHRIDGKLEGMGQQA